MNMLQRNNFNQDHITVTRNMGSVIPDYSTTTSHPSSFQIPFPPQFDPMTQKLADQQFARGRLVEPRVKGNSENKELQDFSLFDSSERGKELYPDFTRVLGTVCTRFAKLYFSKENMKLLKMMIRRNVFDKTGRRVGHFDTDSDDSELYIVMQSTYLTYSIKPDDCDSDVFADELRKLNEYVARYFVGQVIVAVEAQLDYIYDISLPVDQNTLPIAASKKGIQQNRSVLDVFTGDPAFNPA